MRTFLKFERRGLKNQFICWKTAAKTRTTNLYEQELVFERQANNDLAQLHRNVKRNNRLKAARVIGKQNKGYIFNAWVAIHLQQKRIRCAEAYASTNIGLMKMRSAIEALAKEKSKMKLKS